MSRKTVILKNTTLSDITIRGRVIRASSSRDFTDFDPKLLAEDEANVSTKLTTGDLVANNGFFDLSAAAAILYIFGGIRLIGDIGDITTPRQDQALVIRGDPTLSTTVSNEGSPPIPTLTVDWSASINDLTNVIAGSPGGNRTLKFSKEGSPPINKWVVVPGLTAPPAGSSGVIQLFWGPINGIAGTTKIPKDDTTPLITEGTEIWSQQITPTGGSPKTTVRARTNFTFSSSNAALELIIAVFRDNNCIGVGVSSTSDNNSGFSVSTSFYDPNAQPGVTHTYSARVGRTGNNGTWYVNQISGDTDAFPLAGSPIPGFLVEQNAFLVEEIGTNL